MPSTICLLEGWLGPQPAQNAGDPGLAMSFTVIGWGCGHVIEASQGEPALRLWLDQLGKELYAQGLLGTPLPQRGLSPPERTPTQRKAEVRVQETDSRHGLWGPLDPPLNFEFCNGNNPFCNLRDF